MAGANGLLSLAFLATGKPEDAVLSLFFAAVLGFVYWSQKQAAWRSLRVTAEKGLLRRRLEGVLVRDERRRIARDLHDGVAADLTSLLWRARELGADAPGEKAQELERISKQARGILDGLRHVVSGLKLESVDYEAGARGIEQRCRQLVGPSVGFSFSASGKGKLTGEDLHELEHIATEAVRNAVQHSQGTRISVGLVLDEDWVSVRIADNGRGLSADAVAQSSGGLSHLRDRAHSRGGDWGVVANEPGTVVQFRLPQDRTSHIRGIPMLRPDE
jgi:signal transduction histidine kinase